MIAAGNFFFKFRNSLFPVLFAGAFVIARPQAIMGSLVAMHAVAIAGTLITLVGQGVRLFTIGFDYIERGGKQGKVYASRLVRGGVFAMTRNPMYLGNILIALGVSLATVSPVIVAGVLPFFLLVYACIIAAEENFLRGKFGEEFDAYVREVPRLWPALGRARESLAGGSYDWRKAFRKELSTLAGSLSGLLILPFWRAYWTEGKDAAISLIPCLVPALLAIWILYGVAVYLKKTKRFFYLPSK